MDWIFTDHDEVLVLRAYYTLPDFHYEIGTGQSWQDKNNTWQDLERLYKYPARFDI